MAEYAALSTIRRLAAGLVDPNRPASLGRFELRRVLGQGAQSTVWLAFDPRLEREVAIKLLRTGDAADGGAVTRWLQEARQVGRLSHPHIVPLFEADVQDRHPYLVFEYVQGETLAALLQRRGALPALEAVDLVCEVLDALGAAHEAGVVHRDLKPSNILIDSAGRARVMDFGIATPVPAAGAVPAGNQAAAGTPAYLAPEIAQGQVATPAVDVFAAGMVLAELLIGRRLVDEADPYRAIYRIAHEDLLLPADLRADVDAPLRALVARAIARDPARRFTTARDLRDALLAWSATASGAAPSESGDAAQAQANSTLAFLLRRMRHQSDFPAMSDAVVRIQSIVSSDTESLGSLTNEILKDVALTNKLLRLVNSALYARGGGSISTVSRAVSLVGFNGIRNMALGLVLLEHLHDKAHANELKDEFLRCLMAGAIAGELCTVARDSEEAFIGAMFQNLGRLLAAFYFPDEARQIRALTATGKPPLSEPQAAHRVLGLEFEALGVGVAVTWGLPVGIRRCMRPPGGPPPAEPPEEPGERLRWISAAANTLADTLLQHAPAEAEALLVQRSRTFARALGLEPVQMGEQVRSGRLRLIEMAAAMRLRALPGSGAARLLQPPPAEGSSGAADTLAPLELHASTSAAEDSEPAVQRDAAYIAQTLTAGIQDVTNALVEDVKLSDVLRMILETMLRALDLQRVVFCMRDARLDMLTGRFGLGTDVETAVRNFHVALRPTQPDLFSAVCPRGADTLISDATEPRMADRLPAWYRKSINAPSFLLLPLHIKNRPFGLIYADLGRGLALRLDEKQLSLLRTLRNQAVMAFKQSA